MSQPNSPTFPFKNRVGLSLGNEGSTFDDDHDHDLYSIGYDPKGSPVEPDKEMTELAAFHDAELERRFHSRPLRRHEWHEDDADPFSDTGVGVRGKAGSRAGCAKEPSTGSPGAVVVHPAQRLQDAISPHKTTQSQKDEHRTIQGRFPITPMPQSRDPQHCDAEFPFPQTAPSAPQSVFGYDHTHEFTLLTSDTPNTPGTHATNLQGTLSTQNWLIRELHEEIDRMRVTIGDQQRRLREQEDLVRALRVIVTDAYKVQREAVAKIEGKESRLGKEIGDPRWEGEGNEGSRKGGSEISKPRKNGGGWFVRLLERVIPSQSAARLMAMTDEKVLKEVSKMLKESCGNTESTGDVVPD